LATEKTAKAPRRTPGRPTNRESEALRGELFDAAIQVFAAEGFDLANVSAIALKAGVTKATIYRLYGSKENLFKLAIRRALSKVRLAPWSVDATLRPEQVLAAAAKAISESYVHGAVGRLWHSILSNRHRFPEFYDEVVSILREQSLAASLASYFAQLNATGRYSFPNPVTTAHHFSLLVGQGRELGLPPGASKRMEADRVDQIITMFVRGHLRK